MCLNCSVNDFRGKMLEAMSAAAAGGRPRSLEVGSVNVYVVIGTGDDIVRGLLSALRLGVGLANNAPGPVAKMVAVRGVHLFIEDVLRGYQHPGQQDGPVQSNVEDPEDAQKLLMVCEAAQKAVAYVLPPSLADDLRPDDPAQLEAYVEEIAALAREDKNIDPAAVEEMKAAYIKRNTHPAGAATDAPTGHRPARRAKSMPGGAFPAPGSKSNN